MRSATRNRMASAWAISRMGSGSARTVSTWSPTHNEQAVLLTIRELRARRCTLRGIAAELNARGWRTRRASAWRLEHVARIVGNSQRS
jgi:hypothetical protein